MKHVHLILVFLLIYVACWSVLCFEQQKYDAALKEKNKVEQALVDAIESAADEFSAKIFASENEKKQALERVFFNSFNIAMGTVETKDTEEHLRMYLPMLALVEEDGAFFYHLQEQKQEKLTEIISVWSDKIIFQYPKGCIEADKKMIIAKTIEEKASEIITNHNHIAEQFGIAYSFSVPRFFVDMDKKLEFPILLVVFQGWPLELSGNVVYENCLDAGLYMKKTKYYSLCKPKDILSPFCVYHIPDSSCIAEEGIIVEFISEEEAICKYGALPCKICMP